MPISRKELLEKIQIKTEYVDIPEWNEKIKVRGLSGAERIDFSMSLVQDNNIEFNQISTFVQQHLGLHMAKMVALCSIDEDGNHLFENESEASMLDPEIIARIYTVAIKLSGMQPDSIENAKKELLTNPLLGSSSN